MHCSRQPPHSPCPLKVLCLSGVTDRVWDPCRSGQSSILHLLHGGERAELGLVLCGHLCSASSTSSELPNQPGWALKLFKTCFGADGLSSSTLPCSGVMGTRDINPWGGRG